MVYEVLRSPGRPLDSATRNFMERRFGHDFSQVCVHTDARATESAQAVNALAYTVGRHVVFADNEYRPDSMRGKKLLAHELTHVVQQRNRDDGPHHSEITVGPPQDTYELEADATGQRILGGEQIVSGQVAAEPSLQRNILDILAAPFVALARVFGAENYSDDELLSYYNNFVTKGQIEDAYDSDNKARVLVKRWKNNKRNLTPKEGKATTITLDAGKKIVLAKEMYQGHRSSDDVEGVLDLLRSSDNDVSAIITGTGEALLNAEKATAEFVAAWKARKSKQSAAAAPLETVPAAAAPAPRTAEGIAYVLDQSFVEQGLSEDNVKAAIGIFGRTDVANDVVEWFQEKSINIAVRFVANPENLPAGEGAARGYQEKAGPKTWRVWVAAGEQVTRKEHTPGGALRLLQGVGDSRPEGIANTIFHEMLHVWFKNRFPGSGSGHTQNVGQVEISSQGHKKYVESEYDLRFLAKLKEFDKQVGASTGN